MHLYFETLKPAIYGLKEEPLFDRAMSLGIDGDAFEFISDSDMAVQQLEGCDCLLMKACMSDAAHVQESLGILELAQQRSIPTCVFINKQQAHKNLALLQDYADIVVEMPTVKRQRFGEYDHYAHAMLSSVSGIISDALINMDLKTFLASYFKSQPYFRVSY